MLNIKMNKVVIVVVIIILVIIGLVAYTMPTDPCSSYKDTDVNVNDKCIENLWKNGGCPMPGTDLVNYYKANRATMTKLQIANDAKAWATLPDDVHRIACYGTDRSKWPSS
jgi:ABC-type dipeptide/oligopeptide/nickel transport system permease component